MMKARLSMKLLFYIVLCSSFFTLLVTAFQLYMDYRRDLAQVHESIQFIESSYLKAIAASAWDMDEKQLTLQLQGALKLQDVEYLEIIEPRTAGEVIIAAQGDPNSKKDIVREFSLKYTNGPEGTLQTAKLRVTASLEGVYQRLFSKALIILASNAVKMFLASFCIFLIIQFLITRHITKMARYTKKLEPDKLDKELVLDRKADKSSKPDELYELATSFNDMRVRLNNDIEERSRTEKALRQSEERYRRLVETMTDIVFTLNTEGMFTFLNSEFENLTGYPVRDLIGHSFTEILAPEYIEPTVDRFRRGLSGETIPIYEVALKHKDGKTVPVELKVTSLVDDHGKTIGRIGLARDIRERKQAEEALVFERAQLLSLFESIDEIIYVTDPDTYEILYVNQALKDAFQKELLGGFCYREFQGLDSPCAFCTNEIIMEQKPAPHRWEYHNPTLDKDFAIVDRIIKWPDGRDVRFELAIDVTDRKRTEEALRDSEEKYRAMMESMKDAVYICSSDFRVEYMNPAMIGRTGRDATGENCFKALHDFEDKCPWCMHHKTQQGEYFESEIVSPKDNRSYHVSSSPIVHGDGSISKMTVFRDTTDLKKLEAQLQRAQRMESMGTLAGGIAHDFNNLLMAIQGRASIMLMNKNSSHPDFEHLRGVEDNVESAADLTKQLLGFARGGKYEVKPTDLNELIKKQNRMFGRTKKEITIQGKYEENLWSVEVDRGQVEQVLLNIYVNAGQAMPEGGDLYIETENVTLDENYVKPFSIESGRYVKISVTDTGFGMDKETRERIFEPFFTTKEMGRGTGLGLASAYGIIKNHGGFINVYSEIDHGTTFNIYLPASEKESVREKKSTEDILRGSETVLFVDDEDIIIEVAQDLLGHLGYKVLIARSGKEAIEIYEEDKERIDIVLLDMIMPDMSGGETYDRLKDIDPEVKVLLSSGYSINGQATEILVRGCNGFIQKPFKMKELSQKLREILN